MEEITESNEKSEKLSSPRSFFIGIFLNILLGVVLVFFCIAGAMTRDSNHRESSAFYIGGAVFLLLECLVIPTILLSIKRFRSVRKFLGIAVGIAFFPMICSMLPPSKKEILTINFPGEPVSSEQIVDTSVGKIKTIALSLEKEKVIFVFSTTEFLTERPGKMFLEDVAAGIKKRSLENLGGEIFSEVPIDIGDLESLEIVQKVNEEFYSKNRIYIVGDKIYSATVFGAPKDLDKQIVFDFYKSARKERKKD